MLEPRSVGVAALSPVEVTAGYCVFSAVGSEYWTLPAVFQVARSDGLKFSGIAGQKNVYHQVSALAVGTGEASSSYSFDECRKKQLPVADSGAMPVAQRPWISSRPLEILAEAEPWLAFALDPLEPALSVQNREVAIVGAQFHSPGTTTRRAYASVAWPPANLAKQPGVIEPRPVARQLVWYPHPDVMDLPLPRDTNTELDPLLKVAQHGDTILIRHTGLLHFKKAIELERPRKSAGDFKLTFKPFNGSKPILTAEEDGNRLDQSLFKLLSGEVAFEGVQFLLKPSRPRNPQTTVAVAVGGGKACSFTNCVFTLLEEDESRAAAVLVTDPNTVMVMEGPDRLIPTPHVKFDHCVVRGKGRGIWVPVTRAVRVEIFHSLSSIDGPLYLGEAGGKSNLPARSSLTLAHVTAFVGGPLVELRGPERANAMGTSGLASIDTDMSSSLLAGVPGAGQPFVELNGIDTTETTDSPALESPAWKPLCQLRQPRQSPWSSGPEARPRFRRSGTWTGGCRSRVSLRGIRLGRHGSRKAQRVCATLPRSSQRTRRSSPTCSIRSRETPEWTRKCSRNRGKTIRLARLVEQASSAVPVVGERSLLLS